MTSNVSPTSSALQSSMVSFLSDLIRIRSVCGMDAERLVAERICIECQSLNLKCDLVSAPDQDHRPNVIVTAGKSLYSFDEQHVLFESTHFRKGPINVSVRRSHGYGKCGR